MRNDTICAVATALSNSSIGIIRISGPEAKKIADRIFVNPKKKHILLSMESHTFCYGFLLDDEKILDEVLVSYFKAPKSFTAEDIVEINTHGGVYVVKKALELTIKAGARLAEPGEFTKRAFLNGRIDISEACAVMDVISSSSDMALKSSVSILQGSLYKKITGLREKILYETAFIESALDDPEHYSLDGYPDKLSVVVDDILKEISLLIKSTDSGRIIKDGINTVILGKPNAGKSSLLNLLAGYEKAIVTDIPGTTRDIVEERISLGDVVLNITDTAGIRGTDDIIEKIGIDKALDYADRADLLIFVVDSSVPFDENDRKILNILNNKKCIVLYNKSDLKPVFEIEDILKEFNGSFDKSLIPVIRTSAYNNEGIDELKTVIRDMFFGGEIDFDNEIIISNIRQKEALEAALLSMKQVKASIEAGMPEDFYSIDLTSAYSSLGNIIGEEMDEDVINKIFSEFCMGK